MKTVAKLTLLPWFNINNIQDIILYIQILGMQNRINIEKMNQKECEKYMKI